MDRDRRLYEWFDPDGRLWSIEVYTDQRLPLSGTVVIEYVNRIIGRWTHVDGITRLMEIEDDLDGLEPSVEIAVLRFLSQYVNRPVLH